LTICSASIRKCVDLTISSASIRRCLWIWRAVRRAFGGVWIWRSVWRAFGGACGFDDQFDKHSEVCGFDDQFDKHSGVCVDLTISSASIRGCVWIDDQFGKHSEVCGFNNRFGEHLLSVSLGHISVFPPAQECLTFAMLPDPWGLESLNRWLAVDCNPCLYASTVVLSYWSEIPQRKLMSGCFYSLCRFPQHRHISSAARHRATACLPAGAAEHKLRTKFCGCGHMQPKWEGRGLRMGVN